MKVRIEFVFAILMALVGGVCTAREVPFSILRFGTSVDGAWSAGFLVPGRVVKGEVVLERGGVSRQYVMKTGRINQ